MSGTRRPARTSPGSSRTGGLHPRCQRTACRLRLHRRRPPSSSPRHRRLTGAGSAAFPHRGPGQGLEGGRATRLPGPADQPRVRLPLPEHGADGAQPLLLLRAPVDRAGHAGGSAPRLHLQGHVRGRVRRDAAPDLESLRARRRERASASGQAGATAGRAAGQQRSEAGVRGPYRQGRLAQPPRRGAVAGGPRPGHARVRHVPGR